MIKPLQVGDRVVFKLVPTHCQLEKKIYKKPRPIYAKGTITWLPTSIHDDVCYIRPDSAVGFLVTRGTGGDDLIVDSHPNDAKHFGGTVIRYVGKERKQ